MTDAQLMLRKRFRSALRRGTGEAMLLLRNHPETDFSDLIIRGCIKNQAFDPQCEGDRAGYLNALVRQSARTEKIIRKVMAVLESQPGGKYDLDQMCDLAVLFARDGHKHAAGSLFRRYEKNLRDGYYFCGSGQLVAAFGLRGLLQVADYVGYLILECDDSEDSWFVDHYQAKFPELDFYGALRKAARKNKYIQAYYKSVTKHRHLPYTPAGYTPYTYELVKEKMQAKRYVPFSKTRAAELSPEAVEQLAADMLAEKDKELQWRYLSLFAYRKFPPGYEPLLRIARGRNPPKTRLVAAAVEALQLFKGEDIRSFALDRIARLKDPSVFVPLLAGNYQPGDHEILTEIACRSNHEGFIHALVFGFINIYRANKTEACRAPLEVIYHKMNCGIHRKDIVGILIENNALPDRILEEMEFDSEAGVRALHASRIKKVAGSS